MGRVTLETAAAQDYDLCVLGAGPAGCATATAAAEAGLSVLLVDWGENMPGPAPDMLEIPEGVPNDDDARIVRQGLGGTLDLWGGICVPMEADDFQLRPRRLAHRPRNLYSLDRPGRRFPGRGATLRHGPSRRLATSARSALRPGRPTDGALAPALRARLPSSDSGLNLLLGVQGMSLVWDGNTMRELQLCPFAQGEVRNVMTGTVVLVYVGLEVARMLLLETRRCASSQTTGTSWLSRGYIGHLTSSVATMRFIQASVATTVGYHHVRRLEPERRRLLTLSGDRIDASLWLRNLSRGNPAHLSGEFSVKALLRNRRVNRVGHLRNVAADPGGAVRGVHLGSYTCLRPIRHAERLAVRPRAACQLTYHGEHLPDRSSLVSLRKIPAADGLPGLRVSFCYGEETVAGLMVIHRRLATRLQADRSSKIEMLDDDKVPVRAIRAMDRHGCHRIGQTQMARNPAVDVVDVDSRMHKTAKLFVSLISIFSTTSQANPILMIIALSLRLAMHLASQYRIVRSVPVAAV